MKPYKLDSISAEEAKLQYTAEQMKARGLDVWRADPERVIADFNTRLKMLEAAVTELQLNRMQADGVAWGKEHE